MDQESIQVTESSILEKSGLQQPMDEIYQKYYTEQTKVLNGVWWTFVRWRQRRMEYNGISDIGDIVFLGCGWLLLLSFLCLFLWCVVREDVLGSWIAFVLLAIFILAGHGIVTDETDLDTRKRQRLLFFGHVLMLPLMPLWYLLDLILMGAYRDNPYILPLEKREPIVSKSKFISNRYSYRIGCIRDQMVGSHDPLNHIIAALENQQREQEEQIQRHMAHAQSIDQQELRQRYEEVVERARTCAKRVAAAIELASELRQRIVNAFRSIEHELSALSVILEIQYGHEAIDVFVSKASESSRLAKRAYDKARERMKETLLCVERVMNAITRLPLDDLATFEAQARELNQQLAHFSVLSS